jgi:choline dehydrogenase-like flavoprotein
VFLEAAGAVGHPITLDFNGEVQEGAGWQDLSITDGQRQSAAAAYLTPIVLERTNLTVQTESRALKLIVRPSRCEGVRVQRAGTISDVLATREVIVSCGAVDSPRLLLLSGIGPGAELREAGVEVVQDVPGVGRNLHNHFLTCVVYEAKRREVRPGGRWAPRRLTTTAGSACPRRPRQSTVLRVDRGLPFPVTDLDGPRSWCWPGRTSRRPCPRL